MGILSDLISVFKELNMPKKIPSKGEWWIKYADYPFGRVREGDKCRINNCDNFFVEFSSLEQDRAIYFCSYEDVEKLSKENYFYIRSCKYTLKEFLDNYEYCKDQDKSPILKFRALRNNPFEIITYNLDKPFDKPVVEIEEL